MINDSDGLQWSFLVPQSMMNSEYTINVSLTHARVPICVNALIIFLLTRAVLLTAVVEHKGLIHVARLQDCMN